MYRQQYPDAPGMHNMDSNSTSRLYNRQNQSFMERIKNSLVAIIVGVLLLLVAAVFLFWNEGRAVQTAMSLDEGLKVVLPLQTVEVAFHENSGKLVHLSSTLKTDEPVVDPLYGVLIHAVKLKRLAEMYQWVEQETIRHYDDNGQMREEKTYSYSEEWVSELVRSSSFDSTVGHQNPDSFPIKSEEFLSHPVKVGNFMLSKGLIDKINRYKDLPIRHLSVDSPVKLHSGKIYQAELPFQPQIGDIRISYSYAGLSGGNSDIGPPEEVSIIAMQHDNHLTSYQADAGDILEILYYGKLSPREIIGQEIAHNAFWTWAIRFGGCFIMFIGFGCLTQIIALLVERVPILSNIIGVGLAASNMAMAISLSLMVIALGWIRYRPWLGLAIIAMALAPAIISKFRTMSDNMRTRNRRV